VSIAAKPSSNARVGLFGIHSAGRDSLPRLALDRMRGMNANREDPTKALILLVAVIAAIALVVVAVHAYWLHLGIGA